MRIYCLLFLVLAGCTQEKPGGDTRFLLPWRDANGKYALKEVTIETLSSPYELRGEAAEIYYQNALTDSGYQGSIARPHVTKSGDVYIPMDTESALAIAVYAQFDFLFHYEKQQRTSVQVGWPRRVGLELNMTSPDGTAHNNAHYFTALDVIGLLPYSLDRGVPVALNQGIVAHEHFHAHFQAQVINVLKLGADTVVSNLEDLFYPVFSLSPKAGNPDIPDPANPRSLNNFILRSWNEGLADLFAGIYTGQADFITASLPQLAAARELDADLGPLWKGKDVTRVISQAKNTLNTDQVLGLAYGQGTSIARLLYRLAYSGVEDPKVFSQRVMFRLPAIAEQVSPGFNSTVMDMEKVLPILLEGYPLNKYVCANLDAIVSKPVMNGSFKKCAGL